MPSGKSGGGRPADQVEPRYRSENLPLEQTGGARPQEFIEEGTILVDTEGETVGQVNGLSVLQLGDYSFGRPSRVTARTWLGRGGGQYRARSETLRPDSRQRGDDSRRLLRRAFRPRAAAGACRLHRLRTIVRRHRGGQRLLDRTLRADVGACRPAGAAGNRRHRLGQPARPNPADRRRQREDRGLLRRLQSPRG